ncbi:MAG: DUF4198 domain-containing protein [Paracoccaceae bacterium]
MTLRTTTAAALAALALAAPPAGAHEFLVEPAATEAGPDVSVAFEVLSTHVFFEPEEMEAASSVEVVLVAADGTTPVTIEEDEAAQVLRGRVAGTGETAWLAAHRLGQVWSRTPEGWVEGGRDAAPDAEFTGEYEKFAKVLLNAEPGSEVAMRPIGQALEIVPLTDPGDLAAGQALEVQVLHDGEPVEATVSASFDGFSDRPNTYAYLTETVDDEARGPVATIEPWSAGLWLVRAEHRTADTPGVDEHVLRSVMIVAVE